MMVQSMYISFQLWKHIPSRTISPLVLMEVTSVTANVNEFYYLFTVLTYILASPQAGSGWITTKFQKTIKYIKTV